MKIDHSTSTWAILNAQNHILSIRENNARTELLKRNFVDNSYRGFMLDSVHHNKLYEDNSFLIINHKGEDNFRFDMLDFMNQQTPVLESILIKYHSEPVMYKLYQTGKEEVFGKFTWGPSESGASFLINNTPFSFQSASNYKMDYIKYKEATLYT